MIVVLLVLAGALVAFANGGNDQFKGVATLYGSGTTSYRGALLWATVTAAVGAIAVLIFGSGLIGAFTGKGLVPDSVVAMRSFSLATGLATASCVLLATKYKLPVSTTHALLGSLVGAGYFASPSGVSLGQLTHTFVAPLVVSPILAIIGVLILYPLLHRARVKSGITRETCVCVQEGVVASVASSAAMSGGVAVAVAAPAVVVGSEASCKYEGRILGVNAGKIIDLLHFLSGGAVCLARAMNDVPKIAALLLIGGAITSSTAIIAVAFVMLLGGLIQSKKIAATMGKDTTSMNPGQGFTANLVTSSIVLFASKLGLPVSTTHVACGSLFGLGAANGDVRPKVLAKIVSAWILTLPIAGAFSVAYFMILRSLHV